MRQARLLGSRFPASCSEETEVTMRTVQRTRSLALIVAAVAGVSGCSPEPPKARYTVDEYLANPDAMDAKLKDCANNPGDLGNHPDCVNVRVAAERKGLGSLRDLPPMDLAPSEKDDPRQQDARTAEDR
jgi:hypothetical protein